MAYYRELVRAFEGIAADPDGGRDRSLFAAGLRSVNYRRHVITDRSNAASTRLRRGFVISTKSVIRMTASTPAVTPLRKQTARELRDMLGKHQVALEADADPERDADNQAGAVVDPVLDGIFMPMAKSVASNTPRQAANTGPGNRQHHGEHLGQECDRDERTPWRTSRANRHCGNIRRVIPLGKQEASWSPRTLPWRCV